MLKMIALKKQRNRHVRSSHTERMLGKTLVTAKSQFNWSKKNLGCNLHIWPDKDSSMILLFGITVLQLEEFPPSPPQIF